MKTDSETHLVGGLWNVHSFIDYTALGQYANPYVLFDYQPPTEFSDTKTGGVGLHPHRGIDTLMIVFQGQVEHAEKSGTQVVEAGDVQWLRAGRGTQHGEFLPEGYSGGIIEFALMWINLSAAHKFDEPRSLVHRASSIPVLKIPDMEATVRVICGKFGDTVGPVDSVTPKQIFDFDLKSDSQLSLKVNEGWTANVLVRSGSVVINGRDCEGCGFFVLTTEGTEVAILAQTDCQFLFLAAEPLGEPMVGHGPFVMSTTEEIVDAFDDYKAGKF